MPSYRSESTPKMDWAPYLFILWLGILESVITVVRLTSHFLPAVTFLASWSHCILDDTHQPVFRNQKLKIKEERLNGKHQVDMTYLWIQSRLEVEFLKFTHSCLFFCTLFPLCPPPLFHLKMLWFHSNIEKVRKKTSMAERDDCFKSYKFLLKKKYILQRQWHPQSIWTESKLFLCIFWRF